MFCFTVYDASHVLLSVAFKCLSITYVLHFYPIVGLVGLVKLPLLIGNHYFVIVVFPPKKQPP